MKLPKRNGAVIGGRDDSYGSNFTYKDLMLDYFHFWKFIMIPYRSYSIYHIYDAT